MEQSHICTVFVSCDLLKARYSTDFTLIFVHFCQKVTLIFVHSLKTMSLKALVVYDTHGECRQKVQGRSAGGGGFQS
jgi:hypothetical protein